MEEVLGADIFPADRFPNRHISESWIFSGAKLSA
jgi:hypothetical protein